MGRDRLGRDVAGRDIKCSSRFYCSNLMSKRIKKITLGASNAVKGDSTIMYRSIVKKTLIALMIGGLTGFAALAQDTAKGQAKQAGQDIKQAGKDTGRAAKHTAKSVKKRTKKAVHKSAKATKKGANKVENETK